jgi:branched-subunit amino acid transport protein
MPRIVTAWLGFIPVAVLCALLIPDLVIVAGQPALQLENVGLLAAIPTTVAAVRTRNLFLTLLVGMGSMALLRAIV